MLFDIRNLAVAGFCGEIVFLIFLWLLPRRFDLNNVLVELRQATFFAAAGICTALNTNQPFPSTRGTAREMGSGLELQLVRDFLTRHISILRGDRPAKGGMRISFVLPAATA